MGIIMQESWTIFRISFNVLLLEIVWLQFLLGFSFVYIMVKACNIDNFRLTQNCVAFDSNWQEKIRHLFKMHSFHLFCNA